MMGLTRLISVLLVKQKYGYVNPELGEHYSLLLNKKTIRRAVYAGFHPEKGYVFLAGHGNSVIAYIKPQEYSGLKVRETKVLGRCGYRARVDGSICLFGREEELARNFLRRHR